MAFAFVVRRMIVEPRNDRTTTSTAGRRPVRPWLWLLAVSLGAAFGFVASQADYYTAPLIEKALHPRHSTLRSSGPTGLAFGVAAVGLVLANLGYLARRRLVARRWLGSLRSWMDFHVASGIVAAALVALHAGFALRSALGTIAATAFGIVVAAGIVGRYIYARVPRSLEGRELHIDEVEARFTEHCERLDVRGVTLDGAALTRAPRTRGRLATLLAILFGDRELIRARRDTLRRLDAADGPRLPRHDRRALRRLVRTLFREAGWIRRYHQFRSLMAAWRFLHRWLALVMLGTVAFHVWIALRYGDLRLPGVRP